MVDKHEVNLAFDPLLLHLGVERSKARDRASDDQTRVEIDSAFDLLNRQWFYLRLVYMGMFVVDPELWWQQTSQSAGQAMGLMEFWRELSPEKLQRFEVHNEPVTYSGKYGKSYAEVMRAIILAHVIEFKEHRKPEQPPPKFYPHELDIEFHHFDESGCVALRSRVADILPIPLVDIREPDRSGWPIMAPKEMMKRLGITRNTLMKRLRSGEIPNEKIDNHRYRIKPGAVPEYEPSISQV